MAGNEGNTGMRDISHKVTTYRTARARATLKVSSDTLRRIEENDLPKKDPFVMARFAGVQAAKNTPQIIPYCHSVPLTYADVSVSIVHGMLEAISEVCAIDRTGVEVEAMVAASVAALTLYDMLKIIDDDMRIGEVELLEKRGGKSSLKAPKAFTGGVVVVSDSVVAGTRDDKTGPVIRESLFAEGAKSVAFKTVPDDAAKIAEVVNQMVADGVQIVITTGGTGPGPRDVTPDAMDDVFDRDLPGIAEAIRSYGQDRMRYAMMSRARAGMRENSMIVNLPGSPGAVQDGLQTIFPMIIHALHVAAGGGHD